MEGRSPYAGISPSENADEHNRSQQDDEGATDHRLSKRSHAKPIMRAGRRSIFKKQMPRVYFEESASMAARGNAPVPRFKARSINYAQTEGMRLDVFFRQDQAAFLKFCGE